MLARRPVLVIFKKKGKKRENLPTDLSAKLKESEKRDKYLDLARGLKKQRNMKVTVTLIVIGALSAVTKGLIKELED